MLRRVQRRRRGVCRLRMRRMVGVQNDQDDVRAAVVRRHGGGGGAARDARR